MPLLKHIFLWLFLAVICFIAITPLSMSPEALMMRIRDDQQQIDAFFGEENGQRIATAANRLFESVAIPVAESVAGSYFLTDREVSESVETAGGGAQKMAGFANGYFKSLVLDGYLMTLRFITSLLIALFSLPFFVAGVTDGAVRMKIARKEFIYTNPNIYHLSWHLLVFCAGLPMVYFIVPMLPFSPFFFFPWVWLMIVASSSVVAHYPKSA